MARVRAAKAAKAARADSRLVGLDGFVRRRLRDWDVPGAAVGIVERGRVIYARGFGVCDVKRDAPVTEDTPFYIASCTKAFTATAVGMLVDEGKVGWDTPIREYLPSFRLQDRLAGERITARDLLTHRSGLPRHDLVWFNSAATRAGLCRRLRHLPPSRDFRSLYQYNNLMYMLAGWLVEKVSGLTWEEFVRERIFGPLGMEASGFATEAELPAGTAVGHVKDRRRVVHWDRGRPWDARSSSASDPVAPCGSIVSTVSDMCKWLCLQMNGGRVGRRSLIGEETLREMHSPHVVVPEPRLGPELSDPCYGLGWWVQSYRGRQWVHHSGSFAGFIAKASFMPEEGTGVMLVSNLADNPLNAIVPLHVYDRLLGLKPVGWNARMKRARRQAEAEAAKAKRRRRRAKKARPAHALRAYAGEYRHAGYGELGVAVEGGALRVTYNGLTYPVRHREGDVFEVDEIWGAPLEATFSCGGDGRVESVAIPLEPAVEAIVFGRV